MTAIPWKLIVTAGLFIPLVAEILLNRGERASAELLYRDLLLRNPENYSYYENLEKCLDLSELFFMAAFTIWWLLFTFTHICCHFGFEQNLKKIT